KEDKEHLTKTIGKCYNDYYQTQAGIDLISAAQDLLQQNIYQLWSDRRTIVAYYTGNIQENRDEESLRLLKKITDIQIEDYPSHILEQIKITWETWNSPRLSPDSLHLDEIEEINLNNIQEG
ncbi:hypothetical protein Goklo_017706, partial [Gossypium klotzschianum]|nr:hypothetical protein [Gossypium klotzschianum]